MGRKCCRSRALDRLDAEDWGQCSAGVGSARASSCDLSPFVPTCPQAVNAEKLNVGAASPLSPVSPSKMRRFRRRPYACGSGWRSNGHGCQHLRRIFAPAAARLPWRIAVRWPAGSRARLRYRMACTRTGRSVPGFHRHGQALSLQSFHQTLDVLGLEACCSHVPVAEFLKLACATRSSRHSRSRWVA